MKIFVVDERAELYQKAISQRELFPIKGNWTVAVRRDRKRKEQEERRKSRHRKSSFYVM